MTIDLSIVVPAFDEAEGIGVLLDEVAAFIAARPGTAELLVIDDGSTDDTAQQVERFAASRPWVRLVRLGENRGKGAAVRAGVLSATGRMVLFSDADLSTPLQELDVLAERLAEGYDVAIGSRALPSSRVTLRQAPQRECAGKTFNVLVQALLLSGFRDTQCGFKCFRGEAARAIFSEQRADGFEFDVEILCIARLQGLRVAEVPVTWRNRPRTHVRFFADSARMLLGLLRLRRRFGGAVVGPRQQREE